MTWAWDEIRIDFEHDLDGKAHITDVDAYWRGDPCYRLPPAFWLLREQLQRIILQWANPATEDQIEQAASWCPAFSQFPRL